MHFVAVPWIEEDSNIELSLSKSIRLLSFSGTFAIGKDTNLIQLLAQCCCPGSVICHFRLVQQGLRLLKLHCTELYEFCKPIHFP